MKSKLRSLEAEIKALDKQIKAMIDAIENLSELLRWSPQWWLGIEEKQLRLMETLVHCTK